MEKTPDFRNMTADDLREGISTLNKIIRQLKDFQKTQDKRLLIKGGTSVVATAVVAVVFPPAAALVAMTGMVLSMDPAAGAAVSKQVLRDAEKLREKFKTVYRARPGQAFHDVSARREREAARKKYGHKHGFRR